ncbi:creatininase family protein [Bosea sp. BH3]|uniref:creatininase family protein n=1 Tax=Bosea sp. BH3 TaxID=2871701 RepID=UPI0021CB477B|nr:creatininase family protein [Bosea sp. BH3]MCU4181345.1 creatininase family protein [Bosea sp. BH3]
MASVLWLDLTAEELRSKAAKDAVVVLPVASVEQHGPHLPVGVDTILCGGVCKAAAELASDVEVVVAPTLWCGMAEHHMAFGGTFTFDIPTYRAVLLSFLRSIERHGFHRVLIVNGHGGNIAALTAFLPDFARETRLHVEATTYFLLAQDALGPLLEDQKGVQHACEVETSMMMVLAPGCVREARLGEAFGMLDGAPGRPTVSRHRSFRDMTESGVIGDARRATLEKGKACLDACAQALAGLMREMGKGL